MAWRPRWRFLSVGVGVQAGPCHSWPSFIAARVRVRMGFFLGWHSNTLHAQQPSMSYLSTIAWLHKTFSTRQRTAELLRPELDEQILSPHDYELATRFLPGPNLNWHVSVLPVSLPFTVTISDTDGVWCRNVCCGVWLWLLLRSTKVECLEAPSRFRCGLPCGVDIRHSQALYASLPVCELLGRSSGFHCSNKSCR